MNPPERPLVFLLMTAALSETNLEFANDLGRLARGQDVKAIQSQQVVLQLESRFRIIAILGPLKKFSDGRINGELPRRQRGDY